MLSSVCLTVSPRTDGLDAGRIVTHGLFGGALINALGELDPHKTTLMNTLTNEDAPDLPDLSGQPGSERASQSSIIENSASLARFLHGTARPLAILRNANEHIRGDRFSI